MHLSFQKLYVQRQTHKSQLIKTPSTKKCQADNNTKLSLLYTMGKGTHKSH
ncbi:hypothetical protein CDL15_Pgr010692 [Punica granatum]|uniref:Uncharacterized protein n=1 Tax=Punica granatum TaxID=22663 RepID=A0A218XNG6_PUNGR|nr:hypothetical protein CDL15_Pgr010692 [Punica granatum]